MELIIFYSAILIKYQTMEVFTFLQCTFTAKLTTSLIEREEKTETAADGELNNASTT